MSLDLSGLTVILVTHNSGSILVQVLPLLQSLPNVIAVDNGSNDDTVTVLSAQLPTAKLITNARNAGFGRANNQALEHVRTPFALLLNPDCRMQRRDLEALLIATERYPDAALFSPKLYDAPGRLGQCYRSAFYKPQPKNNPDPAGDLCSDFLSGAALMLRMEVMRKVGFFDPWFFLYMEDDDLCERTRRAGHSLVMVADAAAFHQARSSSRPSFQLSFRRDYCLTLSKFYIHRKYFGALSASLTWLRVLLGSALTLPVHALSFNKARLTRTLARLGAVVFAPMELTARRCLDRSPFIR